MGIFHTHKRWLVKTNYSNPVNYIFINAINFHTVNNSILHVQAAMKAGEDKNTSISITEVKSLYDRVLAKLVRTPGPVCSSRQIMRGIYQIKVDAIKGKIGYYEEIKHLYYLPILAKGSILCH